MKKAMRVLAMTVSVIALDAAGQLVVDSTMTPDQLVQNVLLGAA
jgi:hypothetical protein